MLISPENAYLETLILPQLRYSVSAVERAFTSDGRLNLVPDRHWGGGYSFRPFKTVPTSMEFSLSQTSIRRLSSHPKVSNLSAIWTQSLQEVLINGVPQGKKQVDLKGASALSRSKMASQVLSYAMSLALVPQQASQGLTYSELKAWGIFQERKVVKEEMIQHGLCNWVRNRVDDFPIVR